MKLLSQLRDRKLKRISKCLIQELILITYRWLDAFSVFHVNEHGIIDSLTIDRMMPDSDREKVTDKAAEKAAKLIGAIPKSVIFLGLSPDVSHITNVISEM